MIITTSLTPEHSLTGDQVTVSDTSTLSFTPIWVSRPSLSNSATISSTRSYLRSEPTLPSSSLIECHDERCLFSVPSLALSCSLSTLVYRRSSINRLLASCRSTGRSLKALWPLTSCSTSSLGMFLPTA